jgi:hypothetical protein
MVVVFGAARGGDSIIALSIYYKEGKVGIFICWKGKGKFPLLSGHGNFILG